MLSRRGFLGSGMSAAVWGVLSRHGYAADALSSMCIDTGANTLAESRPFLNLPRNLRKGSTMVQGLPFAEWYTGDFFENGFIPFHTCENCFEKGQPPAPTEEIDLAVVGGGISGLCTAYLLRDLEPVLFDLRPRFGGAAQGEVWAGTRYSLGSAYVITPDPGTFLDDIYRELGLDKVVRVDHDQMMIELGGAVSEKFWSGAGGNPEDAKAFEAYAGVVQRMAGAEYPDIPLPDGNVDWIHELDLKTLKRDIEEKMGVAVPPNLAAAIQAYCYSSFAAGWDEISAAGGWNFLAAEEYGRWVCPGGNAWMADRFYKGLLGNEKPMRSGCSGRRLRGSCMVVDVRLAANDRVQVTYQDADGGLRSLLAKRVVMACPKMLCKYIMSDLEKRDVPKWDAMHKLQYKAYVMVNVLLNAPIERDFYDIFLLGDGDFPMDPGEAEVRLKVIDALNGHFARRIDSQRSVLTLYWPLPFTTARFLLIDSTGWRTMSERLAPQLKSILELLKVPVSAVEQVRMTRWGHALPLHTPNLIAGGTVDELRRPYEGKVYFVNQDNWALPAVENCLLDAEIYAAQVRADLKK